MRRLGFNHLMLRSIEMTRAVQPNLMDDLLETLRLFSDSRAIAQDVRRADVRASLDDWSEHADGHTGALFSFCCRAGAHVAASGPEECRFLARYGRHLGRLWHIAEDVAVIFHPDAGAQLASRAEMGRPSLPLVYASMEDEAVAQAWAELCETPTDALGEALAQKLRGGAGLSATREQMLRESWLAQQALGRLPESAYRDQLATLCVAIARSVWPKVGLPEVSGAASEVH
jgi:geranylgeranyl pyrophosphate synthase